MEDVTDDEENMNKEKEKKNDEDPVFVKVGNFVFSCVVKIFDYKSPTFKSKLLKSINDCLSFHKI